MNPLKSLSIAVLTALCLLVAANATAGGRDVLPAPQRVTLSSTNSDAALVRDAIVKAATARTWRVVEESPGQLTLRLMIRQKHVVVIRADYDANGYTFTYLSSENMDYKVKGGKSYIHSSYHRWLSILTSDIQL